MPNKSTQSPKSVSNCDPAGSNACNKCRCNGGSSGSGTKDSYFKVKLEFKCLLSGLLCRRCSGYCPNEKHGCCPKHRQTGLPYQRRLGTILIKVKGQYEYFPSSKLLLEDYVNHSLDFIKKF